MKMGETLICVDSVVNEEGIPTHWPEPWATMWGENEFGLSHGLTYKGNDHSLILINPNLVKGDYKHIKPYWISEKGIDPKFISQVMGEEFNKGSVTGTQFAEKLTNWYLKNTPHIDKDFRIYMPSDVQLILRNQFLNRG